MADDLLKELLTSPLDEPTGRARRRAGTEASPEIRPGGPGRAGHRARVQPAQLLWGLGAAVLGALMVLAGYTIGSGDPPTATTVIPTTPVAPTTEAGGAPSGLPADYTPVDRRLGMRVERILLRPDGVFLTVTTVVENSLDPTGTTGFQGGLWTLVLSDGRRITSTSDSFDPLARGTVSVWFPREGIVAGDIRALELNGVASRTTGILTLESAESFTLAEADGATAVSFLAGPPDLDNGVTLVVDGLEMTPSAGSLTWRLDGWAEANAAVGAALLVEDATGRQWRLPARAQSSGFDNFHPAIPGPVLAREGVIGFALPPDEVLPGGVGLQAVLEIEVTWAVYRPVSASLPVTGVQVAEVTG